METVIGGHNITISRRRTLHHHGPTMLSIDSSSYEGTGNCLLLEVAPGWVCTISGLLSINHFVDTGPIV